MATAVAAPSPDERPKRGRRTKPGPQGVALAPTKRDISVSAKTLETVLLRGNLKDLSSEGRLEYVSAVCNSIGLNPLTRPFEYIEFQGKIALYAKRDATDQLRTLYDVSIESIEAKKEDGLYVVIAKARNAVGRTDSAIGAVAINNLSGSDLANAMMKAETKAKRRVTLSICGLGILDETEIEAHVVPSITVDTAAVTQKVSTGDLSVSQDNPQEKSKTQDSGQRQNATERTAPQPQTAVELSPAQDDKQCAPVAGPIQENPKECPMCGSAQHSGNPCPYDNNGVPRAEMPDPEKVMQNSDAGAQPTNGGAQGQAQTAPPKNANGFKPSDIDKFSDRFYGVQEYVFGSRNASDRLLYYLIFSVPSVGAPVDIEINGQWNAAKWNAAVKNLADRKERLLKIEAALVQQGREAFLQWAKKLVDAARAQKVFVSK